MKLTAPAIPSPFPNPFEGVMYSYSLGMPVCSVVGFETPEMQCGGQVFLFILLLSFSWDGKPLQRPQKAAWSGV